MAKVLSKVITSTAPTEKSTVTPAIFKNNQTLLVELKKLRLALAKERSVPAFVIFSDKTLIQIANELPTSEEEFLSINGVGKTKLKAFYKPLSDIITLFIKSTGVDARTAEHIAVRDQL
jgi:ATP-dependent DNA helicase RecQ